MMKVFLVLYQFSPLAGEPESHAPPGIVLMLPTEEACLEAEDIFNSIGAGAGVSYAPHSSVFKAECQAANPLEKASR